MGCLYTIYRQILSIKNLRENLPVDAYILQNHNLHIMQRNTQSKPCLNVRRSRMRLTSILTGYKLTTLFPQKHKLEFPQRVPEFTRRTHFKMLYNIISQSIAQSLQINNKSHLY